MVERLKYSPAAPRAHRLFMPHAFSQYLTKMTCGIYGIFSSCTRECLYVGQSKNIEYRWKQHLSKLRRGKHPQKKFSQWFRDHGCSPSVLSFRILEECIDESCVKNRLEIKWFNELEPLYYSQLPSMNSSYTSLRRAHRPSKKAENRTSYAYHCKYCLKSFSLLRKKQGQFAYCSRECKFADNKKLRIVDAGDVIRMLNAGYSFAHIGNAMARRLPL